MPAPSSRAQPRDTIPSQAPEVEDLADDLDAAVDVLHGLVDAIERLAALAGAHLPESKPARPQLQLLQGGAS
jgi:hypothetical protein